MKKAFSIWIVLVALMAVPAWSQHTARDQAFLAGVQTSVPADAWAKFDVQLIAENLPLNNSTPCKTGSLSWTNAATFALIATNLVSPPPSNSIIGVGDFAHSSRYLSNAPLACAGVFTFMADFQSTSAGITNREVIWGDAAGSNGFFLINNGSLCVRINGTNVIAAGTDSTNITHPFNFAATCNGSQLIVFTNGVPMATNTTTLPNAMPMALIGSYTASDDLSASIQKLLFATNYAMSAAQILSAYGKCVTNGWTNPCVSAAGFITCDNGSGTNLVSRGLTNYTATIFGTNYAWTNSNPCFTNSILFYNGSTNGSGVLFGGDTNACNTNDVTLFAFAKLNGLNQGGSLRGHLLAKGSMEQATGAAKALFRESSDSIRGGVVDTTSSQGTETAVTSAADHLYESFIFRVPIANVLSNPVSGGPNLCMNGVFVTAASTPFPTPNGNYANTNNFIGFNAASDGGTSGTMGLNGECSWLAFWGRQLSAVEMMNLIHVCRPGFYALAGNYPN